MPETAADLLTRHGIKLESTAPGRHYTTCPNCSTTRKPGNQNKKTLGVTINAAGAHWGCNHCGWTGPEKGSGNGRGGDNLITYDYEDASGKVVFQKVRACDKHGKKFFWLRRPDDHGGWIKGVKGVDTSLIYRKPDVIEAMALDRTILVVEGEKDCDKLWSLGVPATCNAHGAPDVIKNPHPAPKWKKEHSEQLRGADLVIVPDNDPSGRYHADSAASASRDIAKRVRLLDFAEHWPTIPKGGDVSDYLDAGHGREQLDALINKAPDCLPQADDEPRTATHSKNLLAYDEMIRLTPPAWLVTNVLPQGGTAVLFGESNSYKSFIAIDLACCVALGIPWHGNEAKQGNVIYVASDAPYGVATQRIPAWMAHHKIAPEKRGGIFLRPVPPLLDDPQSLATFQADIASVQPVPLIVYDVLAGTMKGSEKETDVIAAWVRVIGEIEAKFQCTQLFVTHSPYSDAGRIRGGTHLWGSFGSRLKAAGDSERRTTVLRVDRHKDHDAVGLHWGFKLDVTGIDELPEHTSLVPVADDDVTTKPKGKKLTGAADEALRSFKYALAEGVGRKPGSTSDHIPMNVVVLTVDLWRRYFDKLTATKGGDDAKRKRFDRGGERLLELGLAAKWGEEWWLTTQGSAVS